jgi:hypothetical protein
MVLGPGITAPENEGRLRKVNRQNAAHNVLSPDIRQCAGRAGPGRHLIG